MTYDQWKLANPEDIDALRCGTCGHADCRCEPEVCAHGKDPERCAACTEESLEETSR